MFRVLAQRAIHCPMPGWSQGFSDKRTWRWSQNLFLSLKHAPDTVAWALSALIVFMPNHVRVGGHSRTFCWVEDPQEDFPLPPCLHPVVSGKLVPDLPRAWTQLTLEPVGGQASYEPLILLQLLLGNCTCSRSRIRELKTQSCEIAADLGEKSPYALDGLISISTSRNTATLATESVSLALKREQCPHDKDDLLFCFHCGAQKGNWP